MIDELKDELILREMIKGKDVAIEVSKIQEIGILRTLANNPRLSIDGAESIETFIKKTLKVIIKNKNYNYQ